MVFRASRRLKRRYFLVSLFWRLAGLGLLLAILVLVAVGGYRAGIAQNEESVRRMRTNLEEAHRANTDLVERTATAEEQEKRLEQKVADLEKRYDRSVPKGQLKLLFEQLRLELAAGTAAERLAFVIDHAGKETVCDEDVEVQDVWVRTPTSTVTDNTGAFADNRIVVSSEGRSARSDDGLSQAWFDRSAPLIIRFLLIDGEVSSVSGVLPISHSLVLDGREYRFVAQPAEQNGLIELAAQSCEFP